MFLPGASSRLPAHPSIRPLSTYISAPPRAGKRKVSVCFHSTGWCCIKTVKNRKDANGKRGPEIIMLYQNPPNMKMMLTVKAYLEVMTLHQVGIYRSWCQLKFRGIKECCWHQGRILPRWCSIFFRLPSHHHEKVSKWYSIGMTGAKNWKPSHARPTLHEFSKCSVGPASEIIIPTGWHRFFHKFALFGSYAIRLFHSFLSRRVYDIKSRHSRPVLSG